MRDPYNCDIHNSADIFNCSRSDECIIQNYYLWSVMFSYLRSHDPWANDRQGKAHNIVPGRHINNSNPGLS